MQTNLKMSCLAGAFLALSSIGSARAADCRVKVSMAGLGDYICPPDGSIVHVGSALTLYWEDARTFEDPVWVDLLSGRVYEFPKRYILRERNVNVINLLPLIDSPCLLTERAVLDML